MLPVRRDSDPAHITVATHECSKFPPRCRGPQRNCTVTLSGCKILSIKRERGRRDVLGISCETTYFPPTSDIQQSELILIGGYYDVTSIGGQRIGTKEFQTSIESARFSRCPRPPQRQPTISTRGN